MLAFAAHTSYQKRFNKVLSFVVMGASEDFLHVTTVVYEIMSVCMRVKQQTDDLYIIICNCIYIVVINCGWNNNVAVKIVACWNWNIFTSSSWLARHSEFVFTIHVRRDPPHSNNPVRSSILWVRVVHYRSADLVSSVKVNLFGMFPCCCCSAMAWTRCCLGVWQT